MIPLFFVVAGFAVGSAIVLAAYAVWRKIVKEREAHPRLWNPRKKG